MDGTPVFLPEIPAELRDPARARFHILPVPYDRTSTWIKGADEGPAAICRASNTLEWFDIQTRSRPHTLGVATCPPIRTDAPPEVMCDLVEQAAGRILDGDRIPIVLGGEHSVSIGAIRAAARRHRNLTVLQIDAHADTRETYDGSPYNHACVMARAREVAPIVQVGIRSLDESELEALDESRVIWAHDIADAHATGRDDEWIDRVCTLLSERVYITVDLDAFDPSIMPATGTPEPGGLTWFQVQRLLDRVTRAARVVAFDVVELCPQAGMHACDFLAAKLVYHLMALASR